MWLAALLGVGILAAVMSTADGLVISTSQVFANDIYRRSIAPRWHVHRGAAELDRDVLRISRVVTVLVLLGSAGLAWLVMDMNVVLLVWVGIGGFTASLAGPLVLGSIWGGVTKAGALWGFWTGAALFVLIHGEVLSGRWPAGTSLESFGRWFDFYAASPYSAATLAGLIAVLVTAVVSRVTEGLPAEHLARVRGVVGSGVNGAEVDFDFSADGLGIALQGFQGRFMAAFQTSHGGLAGPHPRGHLALAQAGIDARLDEFSRQPEPGFQRLEFFPELGILLPLFPEFGKRYRHGSNSLILDKAVRMAASGVFRVSLRNT